MPWRRPRQQLVFCACLDLVGLFMLVGPLERFRSVDVLSSPHWVLGLGLLYLLFGWLFGSYTVLRWPWLRLRLVLLRLGITATATLAAVILLDWSLNLPASFSLTHRSTLLMLLGALTVWSLLLRLTLRWLDRRWPQSTWPLLTDPEHVRCIQLEWARSYSPLSLPPGWRSVPPGALLLDRDLHLDPAPERRLATLAAEGAVPLAMVLELVEDQLERLPPSLLPEQWLAMEEIPWADTFSVQRQLKRMADVAVALILLMLTMPVIALAALLIWLQDRGPVFYVQERSGWMGQTFQLLKLRTMVCAKHDAPATWTQPGDQRITPVGLLLRRTRLDELPQLLNVLWGDMSLIGPRPERPELEHVLEVQIPHYRKRHWMRPGLSGWAQVCAPYAASVEEAELKLSYDLFYLRHWSTWLDLLILAKTIKTVLKAKGR